MATADHCFALFPPPGRTWAEAPPAPGLGDEGETGPGLGDTESGVASGWEPEGLADSGTEKQKQVKVGNTVSTSYNKQKVIVFTQHT